MTKRIVLCADDYGQAEAVSEGIIELIQLGRLSATSCLVTMPRWHQQAARLLPFKDRADIGLHLNFTEGKPLSALYREQVGETFMPLSRLLRLTVWRSSILPRAAFIAEINAQLDAFNDGLGFLPRFIDGHQHIHHLPVVSDALLQVYQHRLKGRGVYMRAVTQTWREGFKSGVKAVVIQMTGGAEFANRLDSYSIPHNTSFAGIYSFRQAQHYSEYFQRFLAASQDRGIIMCHPGLPVEGGGDPINQARVCEYEYLKSDAFLAACKKADVVIAKMN